MGDHDINKDKSKQTKPHPYAKNSCDKSQDKKQGMSTKGKITSAFFILCLTTIMFSYQNCGMVSDNLSQSSSEIPPPINFSDANNCGVAEFDMQTLMLPGKAQIGLQYVSNVPTAIVSFPLPGLKVVDAYGDIEDIPGAQWYVSPASDPPTYRIEIPVDSLNQLTYEDRQHKLPSKVKSNGMIEHKGQYLYGFDGQRANVKHLPLEQYNNLDAKLYYRNSSPQTLGLLVMSEDFPKLPNQGFFQKITPNKELKKCDQVLGNVAYVMVEDEDEDDQYLANNGIYVSLRLDLLAR